MTVAGASVYHTGDKVVLFLSKMPNGLLRTTGWGQGKYTLDRFGRIHGDASLSAAQIKSGAGQAGSASSASLNGLTVSELQIRVHARIQARTGDAR